MEQVDNILTNLFTATGKQLSYERDDVILRAGDIPSGVYLIQEGCVSVYSLSDSGEPNILMSLGTDDIFPLGWTVSGDLHDISIKALEPVRVLRISREEFLQGLKLDPQVVQATLLKLTEHYHKVCSELENLPYRSARERVAFRIISLAQSFGRPLADAVKVDLRLSNEYIARSSNMTRETASREISWLTKKGIIDHQRGYIVINDITALQREVGKNFQLQT